jgi:hypothetical protein
MSEERIWTWYKSKERPARFIRQIRRGRQKGKYRVKLFENGREKEITVDEIKEDKNVGISDNNINQNG